MFDKDLITIHMTRFGIDCDWSKSSLETWLLLYQTRTVSKLNLTTGASVPKNPDRAENHSRDVGSDHACYNQHGNAGTASREQAACGFTCRSGFGVNKHHGKQQLRRLQHTVLQFSQPVITLPSGSHDVS